MKACCRFSHRNVFENISSKLDNAVETAITQGCEIFYTGAMGDFDSLFTDDIKAELSFSSIGGKARTTLSKGSNKHLDYEKYEQKSVSIAGYIRKLPEGQKASEEKQLLAKVLRLSLSDNETYVEPFVRQSWKLKIV